MLIGLLADIHGNIDALNAMLDMFDRLAVKNIYCIGDVVGYGGAPGECIDAIREHNIPCVCGNHDMYTAHPDSYNRRGVRPEANSVIDWNRSVLRKDQLEWLANLPMVLETPHFMMAHSSCQPFPKWSYVTTKRCAMMQLLFQPRQLCFTAHSHVPVLAMHKPGKAMTLDFFHNLTLPKNTDVMIGVGAVGQPRDEDPRACAMLFNDALNTVSMVRVKYDILSAQRRIVQNDLPQFLASRLAQGI